MKILDAQQIKKVDEYTIQNEPISSIDLMERAAMQCFKWLRRRLSSNQKFMVFCGMGNNGGDGLAIARLLIKKGHMVDVFKVNHMNEPSKDFGVNEKRLMDTGFSGMHCVGSAADLPQLDADCLVIDAMLGSGLSRPLEGLLSQVVQHINSSGALVVSIDIPTGLFVGDNRDNDPRSIIHADYTLSFQLPKLAFMLASNDAFVGEWVLLDIKLHPEAIRLAESKYFFLHASDVKGLYRPRKKYAHKGHFGHALLIAGSHGKSGAAVLAAKSALRSGVGLLTVHVPNEAYTVLQSVVPEAMCLADEEPRFISRIFDLEGFNAVGVGPGLGTHEQTARALKLLIQNATVPMVLDADALNILAENLTWCGFLPKGSVFTPHPGEFDRLAGKSSSDMERLEKALELAHRFQVYVVLKGAHSAVACPDGRCFFNSTGNPGMATGGSGDVLTGMILGWMAQNYSPLYSCLLAVFLHGRAADLAALRKSQEGMTAGDIIEFLPKAIQTTFR